MSGKLVLPVFFLVLFLGAMIFGPVIYWTFDAVWKVAALFYYMGKPPQPNLEVSLPFHRAMDRGLLISAVAALGLFWSRIPLGQLWPWNRAAGLQVLLGLGIAAVSIQAMLAANLALAGFTSAHLEAGKIGARIGMALVAAIIIPVLEETIFRGFLQGEFVRGLGWRAGVIAGAMVFMLAHFLKIPVELDTAPVTIGSGATALGAAFANFGPDLARADNLGKAINLLLIGVILGGVVLRTGSLWLSAGLHSGWIFGLLLFTGLTRPVEPPRYDWAGGDILSSLTTTVVLILTGLWLWRFYRHPSIQPETAPVPPSATGPGNGPMSR